jgi:hypothetical protein
MKSKIRIVLGNSSLAGYPQGGGHWCVFIQYLLGLDDLGYNIFWLELLNSTGDKARDEYFIRSYFQRMSRYGFSDRCALILIDAKSKELNLDANQTYGATNGRIKETIAGSDLLWNFCCAIRQPLLSMFRKRVLIDLDPGHLQISSIAWDLNIHDHHKFLTVGGKLHDADCKVPTLGLKWNHFMPFVHLPSWKYDDDPGIKAPFSTVTQWTWSCEDELWYKNKFLSVSKRDAYLKYVELPKHSKRNFELAVNLKPRDQTGDREFLRRHGWKLVHPHIVAKSPSSYKKYIMRSRAEISCPKPIHKQLKTGWFSDRSAFYLASGRPVLAEDTGFSEYLPTGRGLVTFDNLEEAISGVNQIDSNYTFHMRSARELAEEFFDSRRCLEAMLSACN